MKIFLIFSSIIFMVIFFSISKDYKEITAKLDILRLDNIKDNSETMEYKPIINFIHSQGLNLDSTYVERISELIYKYSDQFHYIYPTLLASIIYHESRFDSTAISPTGAIGLMQITTIAYKEVRLRYRLQREYDLHCLEDNLFIGCAYFDLLRHKYTEYQSLSYYNTGYLNAGRDYALLIIQRKLSNRGVICTD